jgi:very-short-patch-repair endonuclease
MGAEVALLEVAREQYLVFTHGQAVDAGLSARTISRWVETGRWTVIHRGVYVSSSVPIGWEQHVIASCLACGLQACASFSSAEVVWEFASTLDVPHVTIPSASRRQHTGIDLHRRSRLDAVNARGFRVTHPMRTLLDLTPMRSEETVERYLDSAHRRGLVGIRRFSTYLEEPDIARRPGAKLLRQLVAHRDPDAAIDSDLETLFFRALREAALPLPVPQHPVETLDGVKYIDFAYPDNLLAIELDGYADRANRRSFENDRARQNDLEQLGWSFRRYTWTQTRGRPAAVAANVGLALGLRPVRWKPVTKP